MKSSVLCNKYKSCNCAKAYVIYLLQHGKVSMALDIYQYRFRADAAVRVRFQSSWVKPFFIVYVWYSGIKTKLFSLKRSRSYLLRCLKFTHFIFKNLPDISSITSLDRSKQGWGLNEFLMTANIFPYSHIFWRTSVFCVFIVLLLVFKVMFILLQHVRRHIDRANK